MDSHQIRTRVSMLIDAPAADITRAFVEPDWLTRFWLSSASGKLKVGQAVTWEFMVPGATAEVTATKIVPGEEVSWRWEDGNVTVSLEPVGTSTAVTVVHEGYPGSRDEQVNSALDGTEGFAIVLCDLKTLLESGTSAGLTRAKAKLIEARQTKVD